MGGLELHLPSFERQSICHPQKATSSALIHPQMSFLDSFQGYYQILLALDDQEKTTFVTQIGNYHYKVMPFGLKNAEVTYQRMMTRMFDP